MNECVGSNNIHIIVSTVSIFKRKFLSLPLSLFVCEHECVYTSDRRSMCSIIEQHEERRENEKKRQMPMVESCGSCSLTSLVSLFSQSSARLVRICVFNG